MNLTTDFKEYTKCECGQIARLEDFSGALECHDCADERESDQEYCSTAAWISYPFEKQEAINKTAY